ncbi:hypothetical protein B0H63DRAFT_453330 [Podospora didyma]|uniref:Uncharacterized protein n=1 Tax=Podospora didyma TaxID=330526 RepID=A0AAE0K9C7_9PEZI|nr:hypothetical protein B0H63DRAFT_453330 [Podospora didyma]
MDVSEESLLDGNLPELLVRDLEVSEAVFLSKSLTSGRPFSGLVLSTASHSSWDDEYQSRLPGRAIPPRCPTPLYHISMSRPAPSHSSSASSATVTAPGGGSPSSTDMMPPLLDEDDRTTFGGDFSDSDSYYSAENKPPSATIRDRGPSVTTAATSVSGRASFSGTTTLPNQLASPARATTMPAKMPDGPSDSTAHKSSTWYDDSDDGNTPELETAVSLKLSGLSPRPRAPAALVFRDANNMEKLPRDPLAAYQTNNAARAVPLNKAAPMERPTTFSGQMRVEPPRIVEIQPAITDPKRKSSLKTVHRRASSALPSSANIQDPTVAGSEVMAAYCEDGSDQESTVYTRSSAVPLSPVSERRNSAFSKRYSAVPMSRSPASEYSEFALHARPSAMPLATTSDQGGQNSTYKRSSDIPLSPASDHGQCPLYRRSSTMPPSPVASNSKARSCSMDMPLCDQRVRFSYTEPSSLAGLRAREFGNYGPPPGLAGYAPEPELHPQTSVDSQSEHGSWFDDWDAEVASPHTSRIMTGPGIPLPHEVLETLRVSITCFPDTMLTTPSLTVEMIRSYSRKLRYLSANGMSLLSGSSTKGPHPWNLPGRFINRARRASRNYIRKLERDYFLRHGRVLPALLPQWSIMKTTFPFGSDYLCDALYAHLLVLNYICALLPPDEPKLAKSIDGTGAALNGGAVTVDENGKPIPKKAASVLGLSTKAEEPKPVKEKKSCLKLLSRSSFRRSTKTQRSKTAAESAQAQAQAAAAANYRHNYASSPSASSSGIAAAVAPATSARGVVGGGTSSQGGGGVDLQMLTSLHAGLERCIRLLITTVSRPSIRTVMGEAMFLRYKEPDVIPIWQLRILQLSVDQAEEYMALLNLQ